MGFGDEFKDMTDREILISLYKDVHQLRERVSCIVCPSPMCQLHGNTLVGIDKRITQLEDYSIKNDKRKSDSYVVWGLVIGAISGWGALVFALVSIVWGH